MNILQIASDYSRQKLYGELFDELESSENCSQLIYVPVRTKNEIGKNKVSKNIPIIYSWILNRLDRILFRRKITKITTDIIKKIAIDKIDLVHAHFLFSDGAVAHYLYKKYKIPYIVSVRNTDINYFYRFGFHLRKLGNEILNNAEGIILVTPSYKSKIRNYYGPSFETEIESKIKVIPNGIHRSWHRHKGQSKKLTSDHTLLFVGEFSSNKRVPYLIRVVSENFPDVRINIVGSPGKDSVKVKRLAASNPNVTLIGRVDDRDILRKIYKNATVFAMLSERETFGLTYVEAMSQGTPVLYTKGQGIDGYFSKPVGAAVEFNDDMSFVASLNYVLSNYEKCSSNCITELNRFNWSTVKEKYLDLYERFPN